MLKIEKNLLTVNKYSRPGTKLQSVTKIAVHYTGNPGSTAIGNRNYFEGLKNQKGDSGTFVSSHFVVGLNGEIIQCIPLSEWSYCTNQANGYSISIEVCHPDATGKFNEATEASLVELVAYLLKKFKLKTDDIIRHYDVTRKQCPLYWAPTKYQSADVANARFAEFKKKVGKAMGIVNDGAAVVEETPNKTSVSTTFMVKVLDPALNIRKSPSITASIVGVIKDKGTYTITETKTVNTITWGKLKSNIGWISMGAAYVKKL